MILLHGTTRQRAEQIIAHGPDPRFCEPIALDRTADDEPAEYGRRGKQRIGQYHFAFPDHAVELDKPLDDRLRTEWQALVRKLLPPVDGLVRTPTRCASICDAWRAASRLKCYDG